MLLILPREDSERGCEKVDGFEAALQPEGLAIFWKQVKYTERVV
jgi:hypothetical protein